MIDLDMFLNSLKLTLNSRYSELYSLGSGFVFVSIVLSLLCRQVLGSKIQQTVPNQGPAGGVR